MIQHTQHGLGGQESESVFLVCTCAREWILFEAVACVCVGGISGSVV